MNIKLLVVVIISIITLSSKCNTGNKEGSNNMNFNKVSEQLATTDKISVFLLNPKKKVTDGTNSFCNYLVIDEIINIDIEKREILKKIILSKDFYSQSDIVKNCTFFPDIGFRFFTKSKTVDLLIAYYCDEWLIISNKKQIRNDCSKTRKELLQLTKSIFPHDEYIQNISIKNE